MTNASALPRKLLTLGIVLPIAGLIGYLIATPDQIDSLAIIGLVIGSLLLPCLLKWHHLMLIVAWNASLNVFVLPGQPQLWIVMSALSFGISVLERGLTKKQSNTYIPSVVLPLLMIAAVSLITAKLTGGFGFRSAGSAAYGGKRYFFILGAVLGYFALTSSRVTVQKARVSVAAFYGSYGTAIVSNLIYLLGPAFYFLYSVFPVDLAVQQALADVSVETGVFTRLTGFGMGGPALVYLLLIFYGIRGILSFEHPWRLVVFTLALGLTLMGGFRSSLIMLILLFSIQFFLEGLHRTKVILFLGIALVLGASLLIPFASSMPLSIQRSLSFLPIDVDPIARVSGQASTEWRLEMWRIVWPQVPQYLWIGKGYALDPSELYLLHQAIQHGYFKDIEESILTGGYHNGPLSLLVSLGVFGALAFLWFAYASLKVLYLNWKRSSPDLLLVNTFLLSYFLMRLLFWLTFYGHFAEDLFIFTGTIGLSVSINGNFKKPVIIEQSAPEALPLGKGVVPST